MANLTGRIVQFPKMLERLAKHMESNIRRGLVSIGIKFTAHVKEKKLSGQALHRRTNILFDSMSFSIKDVSIKNWAVVVGTVLYPVKYARFQELGFRHYRSGKLVKNPFMQPTLVELRKDINQTMMNAIAKG